MKRISSTNLTGGQYRPIGIGVESVSDVGHRLDGAVVVRLVDVSLRPGTGSDTGRVEADAATVLAVYLVHPYQPFESIINNYNIDTGGPWGSRHLLTIRNYRPDGPNRTLGRSFC